MRNRRRQWTEKTAFSTQYLQIPHTFVALPASVSSSCALSFSGSYPSAPLSNICIRQFCTPSTHRIYTWYISVLQQNIVFNINKLYGRKKKSHINKRWTWINFSVNILIVQENQWTFSNTLSGSKGTCKKKKSLKSCTNFSLRVPITIKMLGTGFEPFLPVLSPNKVAAIEVCLYMFIQIDLQNRWSRLSHLCLHNFYQKTFYRKFPRGLIHQTEHIIIVNFSPISPTVFLQQI